MELTNETRALLNHTKEYIKWGDFEKAYQYVYDHTSDYFETTDYTMALYTAGVNPLKYMSYVPFGFLYTADDTSLTVEIPENIVRIDNMAFKRARIDKVIIKGTPDIHVNAFPAARLTIVCNDEVRDTLQSRNSMHNIKFETL